MPQQADFLKRLIQAPRLDRRIEEIFTDLEMIMAGSCDCHRKHFLLHYLYGLMRCGGQRNASFPELAHQVREIGHEAYTFFLEKYPDGSNNPE